MSPKQKKIAFTLRFTTCLPRYATTDDELRALFQAHGQVASASVVMDRLTGRSRGFGFVDMANDEDGQKAIRALNGAAVGGRSIAVNEARQQEREARMQAMERNSSPRENDR